MRRVGLLEAVPFNRLREEMDRVFSGQAAGFPFRLGNFDATVFPALNVWEENDAFHAEAEVPGLKLEDLEISVKDNELTLKGERKDAVEEGVAFHRRERSIGQFERTIQLPAGIDADKVEARLKDGVLQMTLPKAEVAKPRKIAVRSE